MRCSQRRHRRSPCSWGLVGVFVDDHHVYRNRFRASIAWHMVEPRQTQASTLVADQLGQWTISCRCRFSSCCLLVVIAASFEINLSFVVKSKAATWTVRVSVASVVIGSPNHSGSCMELRRYRDGHHDFDEPGCLDCPCPVGFGALFRDYEPSGVAALQILGLRCAGNDLLPGDLPGDISPQKPASR